MKGGNYLNTINERISEVIDNSGLTKTAIAKKLNVSQQYISKLIKTGEPSDLFKNAFCNLFSINKNWLETGMGKKEMELDKENQLMVWAGNVLKGESDSFKRRFVNMLMELDESDWESLEKMCLLLHNKN